MLKKNNIVNNIDCISSSLSLKRNLDDRCKVYAGKRISTAMPIPRYIAPYNINSKNSYMILFYLIFSEKCVDKRYNIKKNEVNYGYIY